MNCRTAHEDSVIIKGRLPGELGALLLQALERASEWLRAEDPEVGPGRFETLGFGPPPEESVPGREQGPVRRADALALVAERFLAASPSAEESLNTADRFLITVHAPAEALPEYAKIDVDDPPVFEDGGVAPPETVRRLGCDAAVVRILESSEKDGSAFRFFRGDGYEVRALPRKRPDPERLPPAPVDAERWRRMTRWGSAPIPPATGPP